MAVNTGAQRRTQRFGRRGSSMVEFALMMPWYVFLFVGAYDFGFISYGLISTESAARVAALYCSGSTTLASNCSTPACNYAIDALKYMPNMGPTVTTCASSPLVVTTTDVPNGSSPDKSNDAAQVTISYTTPNLIPIPGILPGILTVSRTVTMRVQT